MNRLEIAQENLSEKGVETVITNGKLCVVVNKVELELSDYEIDFQVDESNHDNEDRYDDYGDEDDE